jgi:hypothetical protein
MNGRGGTERWFDRLTDHPPGWLFTAILVKAWFVISLGRLERKSARS